MSSPRFAEIRARARGESHAHVAETTNAKGTTPGDDEEDETMADEAKKPDTEATTDEGKKSEATTAPETGGDAATDASATAAERTRWATVLGHENANGRISAAVRLLEKTDMAAADVIDTLAGLGASNAADEGGNAQMLDALRAAGNPDVDNGGGQAKTAANHGWDDVHAEIRERRGQAA